MNRFNMFWTPTDGWQELAFLAIVVAAIFQGIFVAIFLTRPWWRHFVGRAIALKSTSFWIVLFLTVVNAFIRYPGQEQVTALALWLVAAAVVYQLVALLRTPRTSYPPDDRYDPLP